MLGALIILFLLLPFIDLYLLMQVSKEIGIVYTLAVIISTGFIGAVIVRREGRGLIAKLQRSVTAKEVSRNMLEGIILALGGLLLLSPGLISNLIGIVFVARPTRERIMVQVANRLEEKANVTFEVHTF